MGIACSMSRILQQGCAAPVGDPHDGGGTPCVFVHPDDQHPMTWITDEVPAAWTAPFTIAWGDATVEVSADGEEAHEYDLEGSYVVTVTDSAVPRHTCRVTVSAPHP